MQAIHANIDIMMAATPSCMLARSGHRPESRESRPGVARMKIASEPVVPPATAVPIGTIAHPMRRVPPLGMVAGNVVGPATGWSSLIDAVIGAMSLTAPDTVPMVAVMREGDRFVARDVFVNTANPQSGQQRWTRWNLEGALRQAGPAAIDWQAPGFQALVDNRAVFVRSPLA